MREGMLLMNENSIHGDLTVQKKSKQSQNFGTIAIDETAYQISIKKMKAKMVPEMKTQF